MKRNILFLASVLPLSICADAADEAKRPGDSTGKNAPAHDSKPPSSTDQSERPEERKLTRAIRDALMKDKSLTMQAKNVTIIAANNRVILRGLVSTAEEKSAINSLARAVAGEIPVDNLIEVRVAN